MLSLALAVLGGVALIGVPRLALRELSRPEAEDLPRWVLIAFGVLGAVAFLAAALLVVAGNTLLGIGVAALIYVGRRKLAARAEAEDETGERLDFVVSESLLDDALSPAARAELRALAERAKEEKQAAERPSSDDDAWPGSDFRLG